VGYFAYGDPFSASDAIGQGAYVKLARSVMIRAMKDLHTVGGVTPMQQSYFRKTAREFLSDHTNDSLTLWCAWMRLDPVDVENAYASISTRARLTAPEKDEPDD
jgi:hypothetical protein